MRRRDRSGETTLVTEDGVRLDAVHLTPAGTSSTAIVLGHGFTGGWRSTRFGNIMEVLRGYGGVFAVQFRGHGRSGGRSTLGDREVLDLAAAARHARGLGYERVVPVGFSMGAAVVVRYAGIAGDCAAAVAVSGPSRWYYKGTPPMRWVHRAIELPLGRLVSRAVLRTRISGAGWDPVPSDPRAEAARIAPAPLLIVHGDADAYFPVRHARELFEAARDPKELWIERGMGHAEAAVRPDLVHRIGRWIGANARPDRSDRDGGAAP